MNKFKSMFLVILSLLFFSQNSLLWAAIYPVPFGTNSPYKNGVNDSCGGCSGWGTGKTCVSGICTQLGIVGAPCAAGTDCSSGYCLGG
ncbi:MAG: hypothetical protein WCL14_14875, partial [Bacteroidota bacterium]